MKYISILLIVFVVGVTFYVVTHNQIRTSIPQTVQQSQTAGESTSADIPPISVIAEGLDTPWAIVFLPDKTMLVTERPGRIRRISNGVLVETPIATISQVREVGEGGLLGMTLHPDFSKNHFIYLYYTYSASGNQTLNRVVRMSYEHNTVHNEKIIVDKIPGAPNHNGGRIKFGPDKFLYITTGDAQQPSQAQNKNSLAGKILRVTDEGQPAPGNPFNSRIYSYGHRNPQGLAWDSAQHLWETEHGPSGLQSGKDEINKIDSGKNYGWPEIEGDQSKADMQSPKRQSGTWTTWAPAGATFINNSLFFGGLRGQTLYEAVIKNNKVVELKEHLKGEYGRIREVIKGPDGMLYIKTSNKDGRGSPNETDDRILRIHPQKL